MVSFNVYRSTYSGAYVEGICLATDEKPVVGIANGSILFAVDISTGETTRYMYDQESMSWIEAECPCAGGGSGSGGSGGGGNANILIVHATADTSIPASDSVITLDKTYAEIDAAISAGALVFVDVAGIEMLPFVQKTPVPGDNPAPLLFSSALTTNGASIVCFTLEVTADGTIRLLRYSSRAQEG